MLGRFLLFACVAATLVVGSGTLVVNERKTAQTRWQESGVQAYRLVVRVDRASTSCVQEIEVRPGQEPVSLRDTCGSSWFGALTVNRLFELAARLDLPDECFPGVANCSCRRLRVGEVTYDAQGFPREVTWQRVVRPNLMHVHYWRETFTSMRLPSCTTGITPVRLRVVQFIPLGMPV